jgi:type VI secretion system protein ImpG
MSAVPNNDLLRYYSNELAFVRRLGAQFAQDHPDRAAALRLGPDDSQDPHVERLIQAFAFIAARIRRKLDDDFPELTGALLSVLYPHYLAPIPSMAIAQLNLDKGQKDLLGGHPIPVQAMLETEAVGGTMLKYRTCYPVRLWPMEVTRGALGALPLTVPPPVVALGPASVLTIELATFAPEIPLEKLNSGEGNSSWPTLRFFLKGQDQHVYPMYEMMLNDALAIIVSGAGPKAEQTMLPVDSLQPVGFERDQGVLPFAARSFLGYRLLTEYFSFPRKFLFFDLANITAKMLAKAGNRMVLNVYFNRGRPDLEKFVTADMFRLGCTPIINLFEQRAEPIRLTQTQTEYPVEASTRAPAAFEINSIDKVEASSPQPKQVVEYRPFYSVSHAGAAANQPFWYATRKPGGRESGGGSDLAISVVDLSMSPAAPANWTLDILATCTNRDLPARLPFGPGRPTMRLCAGGPIAAIECLTKPTDPLRPGLGSRNLWKLISHLSLNHLSLMDASGSPDPLREILALYDVTDSDETRGRIASIVSVQASRKIGRAGGEDGTGIARGMLVKVEFDESRFAGAFLLASVLERFLGLYCSINSFTQLLATTRQRERALRRWNPRSADKPLL